MQLTLLEKLLLERLEVYLKVFNQLVLREQVHKVYLVI